MSTIKYNKKCLLSFFTLILLFLFSSCARVSQQDVSENLPTLTVDLAAEKGKASVVRITGGNLMKIGTGSGFFVQPDKIVTNLHVIARPGPIFVKLSDDETIWMVEGVTAYDMENDLVILKIAGEGVALSLGDSDAARNGETVYAIGYPGGGEFTLTEGTIRSSRYKDKWLQTTADISKGNSGGPMLNGRGEVIGISTAVDETYSYAVPSDALKALLSGSTEVEPLVKWYKQKRIRAYGYHQRGENKYNDKDYRGAIADLNEYSVAVNVGTGGQVSVFVADPLVTKTLELRPFINTGYLLTSAGTVGGRQFRYLREFTLQAAAVAAPEGGAQRPLPTADADAVYERLVDAAEAAGEDAGGVECEPRFDGTPEDAAACARFTGLTATNFTPGNLARALLNGIARELHAAYRESVALGAGERTITLEVVAPVQIIRFLSLRLF